MKDDGYLKGNPALPKEACTLTPQKRLAALLDTGCIIVPGAVNALFAHMVEDLGFEAVYVTGAGIANTQIASADLGLVSMTEVLEQVSRICDAVSIPVIADIDTGYGNALNVYRTVRQFEKAGCAALQLEDQVSPKRCGHFVGKAVVHTAEMLDKIKAALDARQHDTLIVARTDARAVEGFQQSIERACAYKEAGADVLFVEAPRSVEEVAQIPKLVSGHHLINIVEGGLTPELPFSELTAMGYRIVLHANLPLRAAMKGIQGVLLHLSRHGLGRDVADQIVSFDERNRLTRLSEFREMEVRYGLAMGGGGDGGGGGRVTESGGTVLGKRGPRDSG